MGKNELETANELLNAFEGRITDVHPAHAEFVGGPTVLAPKGDSQDDVLRALKLAQLVGKRVFVRSGHRVSAMDVSHADGVVLSMEAFKWVKPFAESETSAEEEDAGSEAETPDPTSGRAPADSRLRIGVATTIKDLATELGKQNLFVPLGDNPSRSVVSAVLSRNGSSFPRSGQATPLREAVEALGHDLEGGSKLMTELVLDPNPWREDAVERWALMRVCGYEAGFLERLTEDLLTDEVIEPKVDLSLRVTKGVFGMLLVVVRATGQGEERKASTEKSIKRALRGRDLLRQETVNKAGAALRLWVATGPGQASGEEVFARFGSSSPRPFAGAFKRRFLAAVDFAIRTEGGAWAELRLAAEGGVDARAHVRFAAGCDECAEACRRMAQAIPAFDAGETAERMHPSRAALRGRHLLAARPPVEGFALTRRASTQPIPDFEGETVPQGANGYDAAREQYASLYSDDAARAARMSPALVAIPETVGSVELAVNYAADNGLFVVARSGGHQYSGLSSGGPDTLLIDVQKLTKITFDPPNSDKPTHVKVQPGVMLKDLSKDLVDRHVLIPHGECPKVSIGGHVQTGGYGHQLRSFGLALDHVVAFKMVTRDPSTGAFRERSFTKPSDTPGQLGEAVTEGDVFRAVLGGCPGAWGVLTEITFELTRDKGPRSSYQRKAIYGYGSQSFEATLNAFGRWVARAAESASDPLPAGLDMFLTVLAGSGFRPSVLQIEMMAKEVGGREDVDAVFKAIDDELPFWIQPIPFVGFRGPTRASQIAHRGVRKFGTFGMTAEGREFDLPYKKSLYVTNVPFSRSFARSFAKLVTEAEAAEGVKVVFQAVVGRGACATQGRETTFMQRRDALASLVFDVFYDEDENDKAEEKAIELQASMRKLLPQLSGGQDLRMFWGSFEAPNPDPSVNELDLTQARTKKLYYEKPEFYDRLMEIKTALDPKPLFQAPGLTVR